MTAISVTILRSPMELIAGIPISVTLQSSQPATIFYTLDGTDPTINSSVAIGSIRLPSSEITKVILKFFATDGINTGPIIVQEYFSNIVGARQPHDKATVSQECNATFPFGSSVGYEPPVTIYGNTGGPIVDDGKDPRTPDGYDGTATSTPAAYIKEPKSQFGFLFSETDSIGQRGHGIGTLPGNVIYVKPRVDNTVQESSKTSDRLFNPRALVIFQDNTVENKLDYPIINRPSFDLEDPTKTRDGSLLQTNEAITPFGSFTRSSYNPVDNTITYYYYDNRVGRWIISKEIFTRKNSGIGNLSTMIFRSSRQEGVGLIFKWTPFKYHTNT